MACESSSAGPHLQKRVRVTPQLAGSNAPCPGLGFAPGGSAQGPQLRVASPGWQSRDPMPPREAQPWDLSAARFQPRSLTPGLPLLPRLPSGWPRSILGDHREHSREPGALGARILLGNLPASLVSRGRLHPGHVDPPGWFATTLPTLLSSGLGSPAPESQGTSSQVAGLSCLSSDCAEKPAVPQVQPGAICPGTSGQDWQWPRTARGSVAGS